MVNCFPVRGKQKSFDICKAFAQGCGGRIYLDTIGHGLPPGPAFFYGVDESNVDVWRAVNALGFDYYYCDNSYFDQVRQQFFRITKNRLQHDGCGESDGKRFRALDIEISPWRARGKHIVVCPQSDHFMKMVVGSNDGWTARTVSALRSLTTRPIKVRPWDRDKSDASATLQGDLKDAHALVAWSSAAAITAVLSGVPVVTMGQCAAEPMAGGLLDIELLPKPKRETWAGVLADNQFTLDEMRDGTAWRTLK